ncbi:uncharacterized protein LOC120843226, partial [Ixodes scapularis]|uniref:uncharacterized protein LOC120843226 n=1 Tax=Ixodes scapularis TaxID=6945 RepID=UPI001A9F360D
IKHPTRMTNTSSSLLDLFITNYEDSMVTSGVLSTDISDHLPIYLVNKLTSQLRTAKRDYYNILFDPLETLKPDIMWKRIPSLISPCNAYRYISHANIGVAFVTPILA